MSDDSNTLRIGIFAKTFVRPTLEATLDAVAALGIRDVQFNMSCVGLETLPDRIPESTRERIATALADRGIRMAAISGTFNMADPDRARLASNLARLRRLVAACPALGTRVVTLCTGTRDADDMWRRHPDNDTPQAWRDTVETIRGAIETAEATDVALAFEPELANVVDSAVKARRLLDEIGSSHLKVVIDPANLVPRGMLGRMKEILDEAFALLGADLALAHAKDFDHDGEASHRAAGTGRLDFDRYFQLLRRHGHAGPLVLHGLREDEVPASLAFLRRRIDRS